ncbi:D-alanyl-D-alanine carboxypeptidase dacC precursor [uncultured Clostridium sp.]|nr:D-alanyl-D-alanine carboxypeptidase dacC precursor [uncultured Clostridium sp.]
MKCKLNRYLVLLLALAILVLPFQHARAQEAFDYEFQSKSALLMDPVSGEVLFEYKSDEQMPIASVTKVMTLVLVMEAIDRGEIALDEVLTISKNAAGMGGSQVLLDEGGQYTVSDLIKSIIVASGNDASVAMAERVAGSEAAFVDRMNARAQELGMEGTLFKNCTGLPAEGHHSTAHDVAIMSRELIKHEVYFQYSTIWLDYLQHANNRETMLSNTNKLLQTYDGADGIKTGSTQEAGFCLSATAKRGDVRLIGVILGAPSSKVRFQEASDLLNFGFNTFQLQSVIQPNQVYGQSNVVNGKEFTVNAVTQEGYSLLMSKNAPRQVQTQVNLQQEVNAPVEQGQPLGELIVTEGDHELTRIPLIAESAVAKAEYADHLNKILGRWFHQE